MKNDAIQRRAGGVKLSSLMFCAAAVAAWLPATGLGQVNSGSDGSDGALVLRNTNGNNGMSIVIDMHDHPDGIYRYSEVWIDSNVTLNFIPNANNTPVFWLVQSNVVVGGTVDISGKWAGTGGGGVSIGGQGGPGGFHGGNGGVGGTPAAGPGAGGAGMSAGNASYGTVGSDSTAAGPSQPGPTYGNTFIQPLLGGSGGGGQLGGDACGGGGGGGAILIAASGTIQVYGAIVAEGAGANGNVWTGAAGCGSGGAIRLVTARVLGSGRISTKGGGYNSNHPGGSGRIRFDCYENNFGGQPEGVFTQGFQSTIIPAAGSVAQLVIASVGGVPIADPPSGQLATPDALLAAQQPNSASILVRCSNLALNTAITVSVKPASGATVSAVGYNNAGTLASSTATVQVNVPRGGGIIYATAATGN